MEKKRMKYRQRQNFFKTDAWKRFRKNKLALVGTAVILLLILVAVFAPVIAQNDPYVSLQDGNTVLKYSINNDGLNQYVKDVTSQMTTVTGGSNSIKISSLTGTKTLNDKDLPVKESIQMVMESGDNETGSITLKMNLTYHNPGKSVTVTLPDDLNTYQEISN